MGNTMTDYEANENSNRISNIEAAMSSGTKIREEELEWYLTQKFKHYFGTTVFWRNTKHQTIYEVNSLGLSVGEKISDNNDLGSPLSLSVLYSPTTVIPKGPEFEVSTAEICFVRPLVWFVQKFEPVVTHLSWKSTDQKFTAPGFVA